MLPDTKGIHDIVNDQGCNALYGDFKHGHGHLKVFRCERINTAKQKDGLTSCLMLNVLDAKIFNGFLKERN